jgi:ubiquinone/menaquinone biosynthesis C-methylase UbiE
MGTPEKQPFDAYAATYGETVDSAIEASGESTQFFADLKAQLTARELRDTSPSSLLDFGSGIGMSTRALAAALPDTAITGCDPSRESIERASTLSLDSHVSFTSFDGHRLPFDDGTFDASFTSCVFHHIDREEHSL